MVRSVAAICILLLGASDAHSQSGSTADDVLQQLAGRGVERAQEFAFQRLFSMAPTGELTLEMARTIDQRLDAAQRAQLTSSILTNDLDTDGIVSHGEIDLIRAVLSGSERSRFEGLIRRVDADGDGSLSANEIAASANEDVAKRRARGARDDLQGTAFMVFDADGDGVVGTDDILNTISRVVEENRTEGTQAAQSRPVQAQTARNSSPTGCNLPKPSPRATAIFLGGYQGTSVSSVAVSGLDRETSFATLEIEDGNEPIYIVAGVYDAMVVHVTGATERVERFVGASFGGMGVVGLPENVVDLQSLANCGLKWPYEAETSDWIKAKATLTANLSREIRMIGEYYLGQIKLPSGSSESAEKTQSPFDALVVQQGTRQFRLTQDGVEELEPVRQGRSALDFELRRYFRDGIESVLANEVITNGKAEDYDVLPHLAGLNQLINAGAISRLSDGTYSIDEPIARFPAGLTGALAVKFVLRRGVPVPEGNPGHSDVLVEETGECLGRRC